ncbi:asparagine synthase (glutamine-hydrolyzing) [Streptomyces sp. NPDC050617]|uniref:asparagine synthase (glutamine-hydrolyzing) n=1 Tax=Streptomyces sp. NPDC050617 TaxID=3154628 RepID=UPI00343D103A
MCGLAGFADPALGGDRAFEVAARMLAAVAHRGPEGDGAVHRPPVTMAHCALPFVDPAARQPYVSASRRTVAVLNGEVYNHRELRRDLARRGAPARGGDTGIVAELYEQSGGRLREVLRRVRGMYALALYDAGRGVLLLARDPFGKKPLYWTPVPGGVAFASELTALLRHPACPREPDLPALADYLTLRAYPAPHTALAGVHKVRPGGVLRVEHGGAVREEPGGGAYDELLAAVPGGARRKIPAAAAARRLEQVLDRAVERRVTSTRAPLGVLLSGGLDSSTVAALARRHREGPLPAFTAGFEDAAFDESGPARTVARHLGLDHHVVRLGGTDLARAFTEEFPRLDEPLADPSLLPTLLVCRAARDGVRTVLTGDGADELLLGYRFFQAQKVLGRLSFLSPRLLDAAGRAAARLRPGEGNLPASAALLQLARGLRTPAEHRFYAATAPFGPRATAALLSPPARAALERSGHRPFAELDALLAAAGSLSPLERAQLGVVRHFLCDTVLAKTDRGAMRHALEPRSPFLDRDVVAFCAALPPELKLRGLTAKYLLRRVAARHLPPEAARRRKLGFRAPVARLLRAELRPVLLESLARSRLERHGLFDPAAVRRLVDEHLAARADHTAGLWALLCFQVWYDHALHAPARDRPPLTDLGRTGERTDDGREAGHVR